MYTLAGRNIALSLLARANVRTVSSTVHRMLAFC